MVDGLGGVNLIKSWFIIDFEVFLGLGKFELFGDDYDLVSVLVVVMMKWVVEGVFVVSELVGRLFSMVLGVNSLVWVVFIILCILFNICVNWY